MSPVVKNYYGSDFIVARFMFNGSNLAYLRTISKQIIYAITQQIEQTALFQALFFKYYAYNHVKT